MRCKKAHGSQEKDIPVRYTLAVFLCSRKDFFLRRASESSRRCAAEALILLEELLRRKKYAGKCRLNASTKHRKKTQGKRKEESMGKKAEKAVENYKNGYTCSKAVACAFSE